MLGSSTWQLIVHGYSQVTDDAFAATAAKRQQWATLRRYMLTGHNLTDQVVREHGLRCAELQLGTSAGCAKGRYTHNEMVTACLLACVRRFILAAMG